MEEEEKTVKKGLPKGKQVSCIKFESQERHLR